MTIAMKKLKNLMQTLFSNICLIIHVNDNQFALINYIMGEEKNIFYLFD